MAKKVGYVGFLKLKRELASKPGVTNPAGLAASIGRKKYGKKRFDDAAAQSKSPAGRRPRNMPRPGQEGGSYHYT